MSRVSSYAMLALYPATKLRDGGPPIYVETARHPYWFRRNVGSDTPLGSERIAASGGGLFYADPTFAHSSWLRQATFNVDQSGGSDDDPTTVKTWAALRRRIGTGRRSEQATLISVMNGLPSTDPMNVDFGYYTGPTSSPLMTINANSSTLLVSGTVLTARNRNPATRTANGITPTGGAFDWTPYLGTDVFVLGTGGSIVGSIAHVAKNEGGSVGMLSSFLNKTTFNEVTISPGDTYEIRRMMRIDSAFVNNGVTSIGGFAFTNPPVVINAGAIAGSNFRFCSFEPATLGFFTLSGAQSFVNCRFDGDVQAPPSGRVFCFGGLHTNLNPGTFAGGFIGGAGSTYTNGMLFMNAAPVFDSGNTGGILRDAGIFGTNASYGAFRVYNFATVYVTKVWGVTTIPVQLDKSARMLIAVPGQGGIQNLVNTSPGVNDIQFPDGSFINWADALAGAYAVNGFDGAIGPQV